MGVFLFILFFTCKNAQFFLFHTLCVFNNKNWQALVGMEFARHLWCLCGNRNDFASLTFAKSTCCPARLCRGSLSTRKVQTALSLVFTNYRAEPSVRFRPKNITNKKTHTARVCIFSFLVALVGIEPTLLSELDFESSASTSSTTEPELSQLHLILQLLF